jgi:uncharacterized protein (TIGR02001 family)
MAKAAIDRRVVGCLTSLAPHPLAGQGPVKLKGFAMKIVSLFAGASLALLAAPAAAEVPVPFIGLNLSGGVEVMSDYRFRGISRSDEKPAVQAQLTVGHDSGFYLGGRGTTLRGINPLRIHQMAPEEFGDLQLDLYAGYGTNLTLGTGLDAGVMYYRFTGEDNAGGYLEPYASLTHTLGPVQATAGVKYAPSQSAIGDSDMLYMFGEVEASIPLTGITAVGHIGRQQSDTMGSYSNFSLGGRYGFGPAYIGARYVNTGLPSMRGTDGGIVFSAGVRF